MLTHMFLIKGITVSNSTEISSKLSNIDGAKPMQTNNESGISVFICLSPISQEEIVSMVLSAISGTGAFVFQKHHF